MFSSATIRTARGHIYVYLNNNYQSETNMHHNRIWYDLLIRY